MINLLLVGKHEMSDFKKAVLSCPVVAEDIMKGYDELNAGNGLISFTGTQSTRQITTEQNILTTETHTGTDTQTNTLTHTCTHARTHAHTQTMPKIATGSLTEETQKNAYGTILYYYIMYTSPLQHSHRPPTIDPPAPCTVQWFGHNTDRYPLKNKH